MTARPRRCGAPRRDFADFCRLAANLKQRADALAIMAGEAEKRMRLAADVGIFQSFWTFSASSSSRPQEMHTIKYGELSYRHSGRLTARVRRG